MTHHARVSTTRHFSVSMDAHPGAFPRILEQFAKRNLTPLRCMARVEEDRLDADIEAVVDDPAQAEVIAACLGAMVGVRGAALRPAMPAVRVVGYAAEASSACPWCGF